ncbi:hypothetical protein [Agrobacterium sp. ST15.13.015]|uniref:hypothetical protein n=1 Tax=Agrobacterium sp. ST15.13.015 TaxID=3017319 RepID=UPI0022C4E0BC|nr:hypothetical protein [Agrobacterium sp. ST15.13.015]MCZ7498858.1 hypothetical protein [Rhizobium rhizogenes]
MKPVPMLPDEIINVKRAAYHARVSTKTIRRWCRRHGIGRQSAAGAPLQISIIALEMVAEGDHQALEMLRAGNRENPIVASFLDRFKPSAAPLFVGL